MWSCGGIKLDSIVEVVVEHEGLYFYLCGGTRRFILLSICFMWVLLYIARGIISYHIYIRIEYMSTYESGWSVTCKP